MCVCGIGNVALSSIVFLDDGVYVCVCVCVFVAISLLILKDVCVCVNVCVYVCGCVPRKSGISIHPELLLLSANDIKFV